MYNKHQDSHCLPLKDLFDFLCIDMKTAVGGSFCLCGGVDNCDRFSAGELLHIAGKALCDAEAAVTALLGFSPCQQWESETVMYPRHDCGVMLQKDCKTYKSVHLKKNRFVKAGKRAESFIGLFNLEYVDLDGDGFKEYARFAIPYDGSYPLDELEARFDADTVLHSIDSATDNGDGTATILICWYDLISPDCLENKSPLLTDGGLLDLCCCYTAEGVPTGNLSTDCEKKCPFVPSIELYRVYNDTTCDTAKLIFNGGRVKPCQCACTGNCESCNNYCSPACIACTPICNTVRIVPVTVSEDEEGNKACSVEKPCKCTSRGEPDSVTVNYLGGGHPDAHINKIIQEAIYKLAAAWVSYKDCGDCTCDLAGFDYWQENRDGDVYLINAVPFEAQSMTGFNDLVRGGKRGEIEAWKSLVRFIPKSCVLHGCC